MKNRINQELLFKEIQNLPLFMENKKDIYFKKGEDLLSSVDTQKYFYFVISGKIKFMK